MKIIKDFSLNIKEDPILFFNFDKLLKISKITNTKKIEFKINKKHYSNIRINKRKTRDLYFYYGFSKNLYNNKIKTNPSNFNVYFDAEEPNWHLFQGFGFFSKFARLLKLKPIHYPRKFEENFDKILTICPYTCNFINNSSLKKKREFVFFPFNKNLIPKNNKKNYDLIYTGSIIKNLNVLSIFNSISKSKEFNYKLVSNTKNEIVTDFNISYQNKLNLISESRVSLIHNYIDLNDDQVEHIKKYKFYYNNQAFSHLHKKIIPQQKSRMFEAAFCKSLMLVKRDPWNVIENFFLPNKDFLYFNNKSDFIEILSNIKKNYDKYNYIVNNAFKKATKNYTCENFYNNFLLKYE
jgi:hypothetical protein